MVYEELPLPYVCRENPLPGLWTSLCTLRGLAALASSTGAIKVSENYEQPKARAHCSEPGSEGGLMVCSIQAVWYVHSSVERAVRTRR